MVAMILVSQSVLVAMYAVPFANSPVTTMYPSVLRAIPGVVSAWVFISTILESAAFSLSICAVVPSREATRLL